MFKPPREAKIVQTWQQAIITCNVYNRKKELTGVRATSQTAMVSIDYDHSCDEYRNHERAALALCERLGWTGTYVQGAIEQNDKKRRVSYAHVPKD